MADIETVFTRKDYLGASTGVDNWREVMAEAHRRYYAQLVDERTIEQVVQWIGEDRILGSTDPHFNDIPLGRWDALVQGPRLHCARPFEDLGDYPTLAGLVCVAKEAARQHKERTAP